MGSNRQFVHLKSQAKEKKRKNNNNGKEQRKVQTPENKYELFNHIKRDRIFSQIGTFVFIETQSTTCRMRTCLTLVATAILSSLAAAAPMTDNVDGKVISKVVLPQVGSKKDADS